MAKKMRDLLKLILPMDKDKRKALDMASQYLEQEDLEVLKNYLKIDRCFARIERFNTSDDVFQDKEWPFFKSHLKGSELHEFLDRINTAVTQKAKLDAFLAFAPDAFETVTRLVAPNIVGLDDAKEAVAAQLFASDPVHVLLIGDPGTGKTDLLRGADRISPISSFGLGSGVSGVGLSAAAKGDELLLGLLPLAHEGVACIDELNLIRGKDLAALYNAMEKGFVNYDKGGKHETLPAKVRVCATANPKHSEFVGKTAEVLRKQIPFQNALLSRFHMIFLIRKPSEKEFEEITKKIVKGDTKKLAEDDVLFLNEYLRHSWTVEVTLDDHLELEILNFIKRLKKDEKKFIVEVGPRTVVGLIRLAKAAARAELSSSVTLKHLKIAFRLMESALYVRKGDPGE